MFALIALLLAIGIFFISARIHRQHSPARKLTISVLYSILGFYLSFGLIGSYIFRDGLITDSVMSTGELAFTKWFHLAVPVVTVSIILFLILLSVDVLYFRKQKAEQGAGANG